MRPHRVMVTALVVVSPLLLGACSMIVPTRTATSPSPATRGSVAPVVPEAGRSERQSVISIAGTAAAAAQTQTADTPTVVMSEAPSTPPAHAEIPRQERPVSNPGPRWETAGKNADFSSDGLTRITSHITRTLAAFGRSVRQLVSDIR